ncbi:MAG: hypothetical protein ACM3KD_00820, partial [Hyphomicrobiaceae bacterium]
AFGSEPISGEDIVDWIKKVRQEMEAMFDRLERAMPQLPDAAQALAASLLVARPKLYRRILRPSGIRLEAMKIRCHGNYHLGQVWLMKNDFVIANYGGEPGLSWSERRAKHTPLRDVASMLHSLGEAGARALSHVAGDSPEAAAALQAHVDGWEQLARKAFYRSYRRAMSGHPSHPADAAAAEALMTLFLAKKSISRVNDALARHEAGIGSCMQRLLRLAQR